MLIAHPATLFLPAISSRKIDQDRVVKPEMGKVRGTGAWRWGSGSELRK